MGVHGLWTILNPVQEHIPLRSLGRKRLAIDLSGWVCGDICVNQRAETGCKLYLRNLIFRLIALLREAILPVAVTDGVAPAIKTAALLKRRQASGLAGPCNRIKPVSLKRSQFARLSFQCSQLLAALGVPCIASPGEAEAMCAFLNVENLVDGCVTNDGDAFLYGATTVYRHFSLNTRDASVEAYCAKQVKSQLGLSQKSLVLLGLVLGCDYWPAGVPGVGPVSAGKLLAQIDTGEALTRLLGAGLDAVVSSEAEASATSNSVWCGPTWQKITSGLAGCPVTEVVDEFLLPWQARGWQLPADERLVWSLPDVPLVVRLCVDFLDWQPTYALAQFIPILALWILRSVSASSSSFTDIMQPLRVIRKRTVNYLPCFEVEWSRLKGDVWSDASTTVITSINGFFTTFGYRFPLPATEFRTAFPHLVLAFESLSLTTLTAKMDKLSVNRRKRKDKQEELAATKADTHVPAGCFVQWPIKASSVVPVLPSWDSSPENCSLQRLRSACKTFMPLVRQSSPPSPPTRNFISVRLSSQFERRLTLQTSLLAATPPPSPSTAQFDGFCTPPPLFDRLK